MRYVLWTVMLVIVAGIVAFFHYTLPQHDIVRIVNTEVVRMDVQSSDPALPRSRDVRLIYARYPDGSEMEYRNEDTGWGFPFYFKFNSDKVQNSAADLESTKDNPRWVVIRHYGWRSTLFSMYPNALSIRQADGPGETVFPWFNVIFLGLLALVLLMIVRAFLILTRRRVDPKVQELEEDARPRRRWWRFW